MLTLSMADRSALRDVRAFCVVAMQLLQARPESSGPEMKLAIKRARAGLIVLGTLIDTDDEPTR